MDVRIVREAGVETTSSVQAVAGFAAALQAIADDVQKSFGALTTAQLNWKPSPEVWSIAQCIDHLITSNSTYFPIVELVLAGQKPTSLWQVVPLLPRLWGKLLIRQLAPDNTRRSKTVQVFEPSSSPLGADIVPSFVAHQQDMIKLMERTSQLDLEHIIITSPALGFVTYSLRDAYEIIVVHEQRHVQQAKRLLPGAQKL